MFTELKEKLRKEVQLFSYYIRNISCFRQFSQNEVWQLHKFHVSFLE